MTCSSWTTPGASPRILALAITLALVSLPLAAAESGQAATQADAVAGAPAEPAPQTDPDPSTLPAVKVQAFPFTDLQTQQHLTPGGVTLTDAREFRARSVNNLADALRYVPGVWATSASGADNGYLSIRGSNLDATDYDNNGVLLLQDGLPVTAADGTNHNRFIDPLTAREVAVARGANALAWGATNLGGAIDFVSRTARNSHPRELYLQAGSRGLLAGRASIGGVSGRLDGMATVEARDFDGYRRHSRQRRTGVYANGGWQASDTLSLRGFLTHIDNRQQLAGALTRAEFDADWRQAGGTSEYGNHQLNVKTDRVALKGNWDTAPGQWLEFGVSWEKQQLFHPIVDVLVDFDGPGPEEPVNVFNLLIDTTQRNSGLMARYHVEGDSHHVIAGINLADTGTRGGNYGNRAGQRGPLQDVVRKHARSATVFVLDHWQFAPDWTFVYGAQASRAQRRDRNVDDAGGGNTTPRNQRDRYNGVDPRLGLLRQIGEGELYASLGRVREAPGDFDLDNARSERGPEARLAVMRGVVGEIGWRGEAHPGEAAWYWDVSAWHTRLRNPVVSVEDPEHPGITLTSNAARSRLGGVDAMVAARLPLGRDGAAVESRLSATWNAFSFRSDPRYGNNRLPSVPRALLHGEVMLRAANGLYLGPTFDLVGTRRADYANTYRVSGYGLVGLRAGWTRERWELFVEAANLADKRHVGSLSVRDQAGLDDAVLNPGTPRSLFFGARLDY